MKDRIISEEEYQYLRRTKQVLDALDKDYPFVVSRADGKTDTNGLPEYLIVSPAENPTVTVAYKRTDEHV